MSSQDFRSKLIQASNEKAADTVLRIVEDAGLEIVPQGGVWITRDELQEYTEAVDKVQEFNNKCERLSWTIDEGIGLEDI